MPKSALDRVVQDLLSREDESTEDSDDFDRRVAALIVQEAREKNDTSKGSSRLNRTPEPRHHTNTRFLNNVVRGVQSHNRAVLNASSHASPQATRYGSRHEVNNGSNEIIDREGSRRGRLRGWSDEEKDEGSTGYSDISRVKRCERDQSASADEEAIRKRRKHADRRGREHSRESGSSSKFDTEKQSKSRVRENGSKSRKSNDDASPPSKMDRYFSKGYDPMLDVKAEVRQDASGLIEDDGWDRMLAALREKEDRKKARKGSRKSKRDGQEARERGPAVGTNLLDTQYHPKGALREWDKGKAALD